MIEFRMPSLGADMTEGKLVEWKVKPGDAVKRGDILAVVDTSKAAVDVESWEAGTLHEIVVAPGTTVAVGTVLALLLAPGESPERSIRPAAPAIPAAAAPVRAASAPRAPAGGVTVSRRRISPAARKHADDKGVDLDTVQGTGPEGAVTVEDVERAARGAKAAAVPDRGAEMRKAIAAAMSRSKREIPHYYLSESIPMRRASDWLARENEQRPIATRVLMAALQLKAVALALERFPDLNGFLREGVRVPSAAVHAGVAISLRQGGLVAPAIHDVQAKPLPVLMEALRDLVKRARAGSLRSSEMSDPTITVTNLGEGGVESVFGVIYPPQVAIVGFGTITPRPWAQDGGLHVLPVMTASLAGDHRVSDGHRGALFLAEVARRLQEPETL